MIKIKALITVIIFVMFFINSYSQDSTKVAHMILPQIQSWPNTGKSAMYLKADSANGVWIKVWGFENDSLLRGRNYFLKEKQNLAQIQPHTSLKDVFYIIPDSHKLKKYKKKVINIELWVVLPKKELYYPIPKNKGERIYDQDGIVLPEKVLWKNIKSVFIYKNGSCKIRDGLYFHIK